MKFGPIKMLGILVQLYSLSMVFVTLIFSFLSFFLSCCADQRVS